MDMLFPLEIYHKLTSGTAVDGTTVRNKNKHESIIFIIIWNGEISSLGS